MTAREKPAAERAERLTRLRALSRSILKLERLWPTLNALIAAACLFLTIAWLGGWAFSPPWMKTVLWAFVGLAFLLPVASAVRFRNPSETEALRRLDSASEVKHRPATTALDTISSDDSLAQRLWRLHQSAAFDRARRMPLPRFAPRTPMKDPFALRAALLLAAIASAFVAGPEKGERIRAAFHLSSSGDTERSRRLDAWMDPPAYTGRPPIVLLSAGNAVGPQRSIEAPIGSTLLIRSPDKIRDRIVAADGLDLSEAGGDDRDNQQALQEIRYLLKKSGRVVLQDANGGRFTFEFLALPDNGPSIAFRREPQTDGDGALSIAHQMSDDYGVVAAEASYDSPSVRDRRAESAPLFSPPQTPLALPPAGAQGQSDTLTDLAEHPWAGAEASIRLIARDEGGNVGESEDLHIRLPEKTFTKSLAKSLVEQRRHLVFFPSERNRVIAALDALSSASERFQTSAAQHLGLRIAQTRLQSAKSDDDLRSVVAFLWEMAVQIENGDLSSAERDLRAAQENLQAALERGAEEDELRKLMNELRAALDRFLRELAENAERQDQQGAKDEIDPQRMITSQDLQKLLDQIEKMARSGNPEDAKRALSELQNLLKNLQTAKKGQDRSTQESNRALNQLDQMLRDQQQLRDRTFRPNAGEENGRQADSDLSQNQRDIRQRLEDLQRRMRELGMRADEGLEDAEGAMREAEDQLGRGAPGRQEALDAQGRAIEGLTKGAESLARQMQQGDQNDGAQAGGPPNSSGRNASSDPLGRDSRTRGDQSRSAYDPLGTPAPQRAQKLLEELRRRLADPNRQPLELDYLERLLRRY